jgi:dienelactone hydrolase
MRPALRLLPLAIALASWLGAGAALAGSLVEFPNVSERAPKLLGYLARPAGDGPFPAIVVLHGCSGFSGAGSLQLADQLKDWGYVALMVDSFGPRGMTTACGGSFTGQPGDAYAALRYLARRDFVDAARVAVLGNSMGGSSALYAVDRDLLAQYFTERFRAAVAYYPLRHPRGDADGAGLDPDRRGGRLDPGGTVP